MEIPFFDTSTKRSLIFAYFDKISKSGDGGGSGDSIIRRGTDIVLDYMLKIQVQRSTDTGDIICAMYDTIPRRVMK